MKRSPLAFALILAMSGAGLYPAAASVIEVTAKCPEKVLAGDPFLLEVEVTVDGGAAPTPEMPNIPGLSFSFQGSGGVSTSIQVNVNGRGSTRITQPFQFVGQANAKGRYNLAGVRCGGKEAPPVQLTVLDPTETGAGQKQQAPIFVEAVVDKKEIWQGEPIVLDLVLYYQGSPPRDLSADMDEVLKPFGAKRLDGAEPPRKTLVNSVSYIKAPLARWIIFPLEPGAVTIPSIRLRGRVEARGRSNDPFDSFFSFSRGVELDRAVGGPVMTQPIKIEVKAIPEDGKPQNFSGAVGQNFTFTADLTKREVSVGEAFDLKLTVKGSGNLESMGEPQLNFPKHIEIFQSDRDAKSGMKDGHMYGEITYTYVLIARQEGKVVLEPIPFTYFSTSDGRYVTLKQGPFVLQVKPDQGQAITYMQGARKRIRVTGQDFRHIRGGEIRLSDEGRPAWEGLGFWVVFAGPWLGFAGVVAKKRREDFLRRNPQVSRRIEARGALKVRLAQAERLVSSGGSEFYSALETSLHDLLSAQTGLSTRGLTRSQFRDLLSGDSQAKEAGNLKKTIHEDLLNRLVILLDDLDQQRFAPVACSSEDRSALLKRLRDILSEIKNR